jgi:hypothetical protein
MEATSGLMRGGEEAFIDDVSSGKAVHSNSAGTQQNSHARTSCVQPTFEDKDIRAVHKFGCNKTH